ncbi:MAG: SDR family NAD(P)-dependent oxidoreductase, partial [Actinobacteria bacterium]|nr:SDR family NAD(P)-dependent oxidoreductase [Actinomycetota bacterium]
MTSPRTALVTGANSGIGLATALELAHRGYTVVGTVRSPEKADHLLRCAADAGRSVRPIELDVRDAERCAEVISEVRPDVLVNNAGLPIVGAVEDIGDDDAWLALDTMAVAPIRLARLCLPHLREQGWGRIVQVSSIYGRMATPFMGWYQAAKQALEAATDALRAEIAGEGIAISIIEPGGVDTPLWHKTRERLEACSGRHAGRYDTVSRLSTRAQPFYSDADTVADRIARVVESDSPPDRLLVGWDARLLTTLGRVTPSPVSKRALR